VSDESQNAFIRLQIRLPDCFFSGGLAQFDRSFPNDGLPGSKEQIQQQIDFYKNKYNQ